MAVIVDSKKTGAVKIAPKATTTAIKAAATKSAAIAKEVAARSSYSSAMQQLAAYKASGQSAPATSTSNSNKNNNNSNNTGSYGDTTQPDVSAQAASADDYYQKLLDAKQAGILGEFEANASVIKSNLAKALSNLEAEKAALSPIYQNQLATIAQNQFSSGEQMKELMNQGGWSGANSGLAIGEQGKIQIGADNARGEALNTYNQGVADIARRNSLTQQTAADELASLEIQKNAKLQGAQSEAWLTNQDRIDAAAKAAQDYAAKLASGSNGSSDTTTKALAAKSSSIKRNLTSQIDSLVSAKNVGGLSAIRNAIVSDPDLSDSDFKSLNDYLDKKITSLEEYWADTQKKLEASGQYNFVPVSSR